ncbi:hypothetical protein AA0242T_2777 [Acetobacter aceti NRIC 0242]|uniref:Uncharacterized protein n=1 Tax=Acetobacter aceti NBRC 14818 TaxID=887700 RepID=A0AB33ILK9_ACEAC|nr:hypothetical protein EDC15_1169 [Acetobacter aceti NBRC 14818]BCK76752.1 hypothetical protein EMQ_2358 [Acetobacter aceti NBRC 14818]GAN58818.1 hypothetical protein Abac_079_010 [Acetobacter aceti NBRC 14818]GBO82075.1 hypothetical protein AA0242T_2777 [Acetobacter aceti NRIC 0242]
MTARRDHSMTDPDAGVAALRQTEAPVRITGKPRKIVACTASSDIASCRSDHKNPFQFYTRTFMLWLRLSSGVALVANSP